jgi:hypothetical protein
MFNKLILPIASILILFFAVACGSSGALGSDETAVAGVVLDAESYERIADATVRLVDADRSATTNENGVFTFVGISIGTHDVVIEAADYGTVETTLEAEQGGSRVELKIER